VRAQGEILIGSVKMDLIKTTGLMAPLNTVKK
jgi:hypothetical protein